MLEFFIDNIFVQFGGRIFQQTIGPRMETNGASLLADLLLYSYEAGFISDLIRQKERRLARSVSSIYR